MNDQTLRALLVDDDADHAELVCRTLQRQEPPFQVTVVGDGVACLEAMAREPYAVVLLDYNLPRMSGLEVLEQLRRRGISIPVVMVTGQGDERVAVEAMKAGAVDYIVKTRGYLTTLPTAIHKALKQHELALDNARLFETARTLGRDLAWERDRLEAILRGMGEAVIVTDTKDRVILLNPVAQEWLGVREDDVGGQPLLFSLADLEFAAEWSRWFDEDRDFSKREFHIASPAIRVLSATRSQFRNETGEVQGQVTVLRDTTRERELDRLKSEFISNVSHELRTPMASIRGFSFTIFRDKKMAPETRERFLGIIFKESERLMKLIEDLLDISRMESGRVHLKPLRISLSEEVERSIAVLTPLFEDKGVTLVTALDGDECEIMGDPDRVCQVVQNLLGNALKYTPTGGLVEVGLRRNGETVALEVEDTGVGIAPEHLPHIFERFYRVPGNESGGTGLGLTIVKDLIERHGGGIDVESEPGRGSRFRVTFPIQHPKKEEHP